MAIADSIGSGKRLSVSALLCADILLNCNVYSNSERQSAQHLILAEATHHLEVEPSQFIISHHLNPVSFCPTGFDRYRTPTTGKGFLERSVT